MVANSAVAARAYHHGDLRAALIEEGLRLLEAVEPAGLSLREIARNVGVSATAVYRHFPDKDALLAALAEHGLELLAQRQRAVLARSRGNSGFAALGRAYVRFALAHPGLYRLMFTHHDRGDPAGSDGPNDLRAKSSAGSAAGSGSEPGSGPDAGAAAASAAGLLREQVARALGAAATEQKIAVTAIRAWALVHGLSMLILDRQVSRDAGVAMIDAVISAEAVGLG